MVWVAFFFAYGMSAEHVGRLGLEWIESVQERHCDELAGDQEGINKKSDSPSGKHGYVKRDGRRKMHPTQVMMMMMACCLRSIVVVGPTRNPVSVHQFSSDDSV